jgi:hypothetical protein
MIFSRTSNGITMELGVTSAQNQPVAAQTGTSDLADSLPVRDAVTTRDARRYSMSALCCPKWVLKIFSKSESNEGPAVTETAQQPHASGADDTPDVTGGTEAGNEGPAAPLEQGQTSRYFDLAIELQQHIITVGSDPEDLVSSFLPLMPLLLVSKDMNARLKTHPLYQNRIDGFKVASETLGESVPSLKLMAALLYPPPRINYGHESDEDESGLSMPLRNRMARPLHAPPRINYGHEPRGGGSSQGLVIQAAHTDVDDRPFIGIRGQQLPGGRARDEVRAVMQKGLRALERLAPHLPDLREPYRTSIIAFVTEPYLCAIDRNASHTITDDELNFLSGDARGLFMRAFYVLISLGPGLEGMMGKEFARPYFEIWERIEQGDGLLDLGSAHCNEMFDICILNGGQFFLKSLTGIYQDLSADRKESYLAEFAYRSDSNIFAACKTIGFQDDRQRTLNKLTERIAAPQADIGQLAAAFKAIVEYVQVDPAAAANLAEPLGALAETICDLKLSSRDAFLEQMEPLVNGLVDFEGDYRQLTKDQVRARLTGA